MLVAVATLSTSPSNALLRFMRVMVRFLVPYVLAVMVASFSMVTIMITRAAVRQLPISAIYPAPFESVLIVAPLIAVFALIPAILATLIGERGDPNKTTLRFAAFGLGTGLIVTLDFLSLPIGEELLGYSWTMMMFVFSGLLGGATFGIVRKQVLRVI